MAFGRKMDRIEIRYEIHSDEICIISDFFTSPVYWAVSAHRIREFILLLFFIEKENQVHCNKKYQKISCYMTCDVIHVSGNVL